MRWEWISLYILWYFKQHNKESSCDTFGAHLDFGSVYNHDCTFVILQREKGPLNSLHILSSGTVGHVTIAKKDWFYPEIIATTLLFL